jgi:SAM-dependent methyltransferase
MERDESYRARSAAELVDFEQFLRIHELPAAFHYWSGTYIRPKLEPFGFASPVGMFERYLEARFSRTPGGPKRFVSIGAGNCDTEIGLAVYLRSKGLGDFVIDCVELNGAMLERGRESALAHGVKDRVAFVQADFNDWVPGCEYDAVIANQSLHHVLNLEHLLDAIRQALRPAGVVLVSDIIGRNGHRRWPEALTIVHEFWRRLPPSYRYNPPLRRYEEMLLNWDCSERNFEGIRAQDILPLLLERFHFHVFSAFGNVIDPFIDRAFGFHFDMSTEWDRAFIDEVHRRDELELAAGNIKPTHLVAVLGVQPPPAMQFHPPFTPEFCVRKAEPVGVVGEVEDAYAWGSWPHEAREELRKVCRWLKAAEDRIVVMDAEIERLNAQFVERSGWAVRLDRELAAAAALALERGELVAERTAWAQRRDADVRELETHIRRLEDEARRRTGVIDILNARLRRVRWATRLLGLGD